MKQAIQTLILLVMLAFTAFNLHWYTKHKAIIDIEYQDSIREYGLVRTMVWPTPRTRYIRYLWVEELKFTFENFIEYIN